MSLEVAEGGAMAWLLISTGAEKSDARRHPKTFGAPCGAWRAGTPHMQLL